MAALSLASGSAALYVPSVPASLQFALLALVVAPVLEELAFRGTLQGVFQAALGRFGIPDQGPFSPSNLLAGIAFASCHLPFQSVPMACAILVPSLALGRVREVTGSVRACILLHAWFTGTDTVMSAVSWTLGTNLGKT